ncbi:MAG: hypothetical protein ACRC8S_22525 [Fimbriiglobus sp.]
MNFSKLPSQHLRAIWLAVFLLLCPSLGCKWLGGDSKPSEPLRAKGDPIFGLRLPPQGVLGPEKDDVAKDRRDPILTSPASRDRSKPSEADLPPRAGMEVKPEFRPVPAALANPRKPSDELTIERKPKTSESAAIPLAIPANMGEGYEEVIGALKRLGAKWTKPSHTNEGFTVNVDVPQSLAKSSPMRRYMGLGETPAAALKSALEQIKSDSKRR